MGFGVLSGFLVGSRGVQGSLLNLYRALVWPSGYLIRHQIWSQTPYNGPNGHTVLGDPFLESWGPFGAPKRPLYEQIKPFWKPKMPYMRSKMHFMRGDHPDGALSDIWDQI